MTIRGLRFSADSPAALGQNAPYQFASRYALVHYRSKTVCSFIPKNACTSLRVSLAIANGLLEAPEQWRWLGSNTSVLRADLRDLATARRTFVILRCPYRRLVSAFLEKIVRRTQAFWTLHRLTGHQLDVASFTFRQFVELLKQPRLHQADHHWRRQVDFLIYRRYDSYLALETLDSMRADFPALAGFTLHETRHLTRHGTNMFTLLQEGDFTDMPLVEIEALAREGLSPAYDRFYDSGLIRDVAGIYAEDLALFRERCDARHLLFSDEA